MTNYKQYNTKRYNEKAKRSRIRLGIEQMINNPVINMVWIFWGLGIGFLLKIKQLILMAFDVSKILSPIFNGCMIAFVIIFPVIVAFGIMREIGELTAKKDEADVYRVFCEGTSEGVEVPILIHKKKNKKKNITIREFYTTIPMERWQEKKEAIADVMNVHFIGEIEYGGKYDGNRILMKTGKGRKMINKEVLYDDFF